MDGQPGEVSDATGAAHAAGPVADSPPALPLAELPGPVRARLVTWAAEVLGTLPAPQVPAGLGRLARFAPAKRAKAAAPILLAALDQDVAFRAVVANAAPTDSADPVDAAAAAVLTGHRDAERFVADVRAGSEVAALRAELDQARSELVRLRRAATVDRPAGPTDTGAEDPQLVRLRQRLRDQGVRLRTAEIAAADAEERFAGRLAELTAELDRARDEVEQWRQKAQTEAERADRAQETVARQRSGGQAARAQDDRRLDLLLSTVEGAVTGLRRELELTGGGSNPADTVAAGLSAVPRETEGTDDPRRLQTWLGLPGAHLIVDGYNVSKSGFGELTLLDQRDRLIRLLSGLAARTSAEITVVFDGAAVVAPPAARRGVRVLFSPPGVLADDVIADLAAAEPVGRVLVVVTSDADVVRRVRRSRARTAPSATLLGLFRS